MPKDKFYLRKALPDLQLNFCKEVLNLTFVSSADIYNDSVKIKGNYKIIKLLTCFYGKVIFLYFYFCDFHGVWGS